MNDIQKKLFELSDKEYAAFQAKLTPTVDPELFIGVRVPLLRKFTKEYAKNNDIYPYLKTLPHHYYDENIVHGLFIETIKDFDKCVEEIDRFLPYVDNWAVCDIMSPKVLGKHKDKLLKKIVEWTKSDKTYTIRFGIEMLMSYFLDADFDESYFKVLLPIKSDEYYVNMMLAWYYATALAKQWDATIKLLENKQLPVWVHNKTIQKAKESYRITPEQKEYLKTLHIK